MPGAECVTPGCARTAHYRDGRCKPCWRREVWYPRHADRERARARQVAAAKREAGRVERASAPRHFVPPAA